MLSTAQCRKRMVKWKMTKKNCHSYGTGCVPAQAWKFNCISLRPPHGHHQLSTHHHRHLRLTWILQSYFVASCTLVDMTWTDEERVRIATNNHDDDYYYRLTPSQPLILLFPTRKPAKMCTRRVGYKSGCTKYTFIGSGRKTGAGKVPPALLILSLFFFVIFCTVGTARHGDSLFSLMVAKTTKDVSVPLGLCSPDVIRR